MNESKHECPFCKYIDPNYRRDHARFITRLQVSTAILESNQICRGYSILVYNKEHVTELFQLTEKERAAYMEDLNRLARALFDAYHPHKMNYELLGNVIPHLHWHIIPRRKSDSIDLHWPIWGKDYTKVELSDDEYRGIVGEIRANLV